jgi:poly(hydroxyalkanoate) granule-associated protein
MAKKATTKKAGAKKAARAKKNGKVNAGDILRRPLLISIGALALAEEQASDLIDSLIEKGEKAQKAGEKYLKKLNKKASETFEKPKKNPAKKDAKEDWILRALHWLNVPTRQDIEKLNSKVDTLMRKVA